MRPCLRRLTAVTALATSLPMPGMAMAAGDPAAGVQIFKKCAACHSTDAGVNKVGPSLAGVMGKPAGSAASYNYSPALKAAAAKGLVWDEATLAAYVENPRKYLAEKSGDASLLNKMPFSLPDAQQRADVAAYLKSLVAP